MEYFDYYTVSSWTVSTPPTHRVTVLKCFGKGQTQVGPPKGRAAPQERLPCQDVACASLRRLECRGQVQGHRLQRVEPASLVNGMRRRAVASVSVLVGKLCSNQLGVRIFFGELH